MMKWKFWQKKETSTHPKGLSKPKDLPEFVGRYLVVDRKMEPDWVWSLKAVMRRRETESSDIRDIRVFNPAHAGAAGVSVRNYLSLDDHPDLVLYEGWVNPKTSQMKLTGKTMEEAA
jgi:hypothetical protein